jgi:biotin carboxyl carrier protein
MKAHFVCKRGRAKETVTVEALGEARYAVVVGETTLQLDLRRVGPGEYTLLDGDRVHDMLVSGTPGAVTVHRRGGAATVRILDEGKLAREAISRRASMADAAGEFCVEAPMPGRVVKRLVAPGETVAEGQGVIIVEAMKMENELRSAVAGTVKSVAVAEGADVEAGQRLVIIDVAAEEAASA